MIRHDHDFSIINSMESSKMKFLMRQALLFGLLCFCASSSLARNGKIDSADETDTSSSVAEMAAATLERPVDDITDSRIRAAIKGVNPETHPDYIGYSSIPGILEVIVNGQVIFVSDDGRYMMSGAYDIVMQQDVSQAGAMPGRRLHILKEIPASERIVFAPVGPVRHTVTVFTDTECGFCRKFHQEIAEYNRLGIAVEYLAYPRAGMDSKEAVNMQSVWCSSDRRKAMTDAKNGATLPALSCANPVAKHLEIGQRIGLRGTPMIINADGIAFPGYMPPDKLLDALEKQASRRGSR
jgi:thiol:disulfide interchange protein DsbC